MMNNIQEPYNNLRAIIWIAIVIFLVYSNSFKASWHLDDYDNIVSNPGVHMTDLYPQSIVKSFYASVDGGQYTGASLYRPTVMLTFAINWYLGQDNVLGYHIVNLIIHILSGIFLFLTVQLLLKTPRAFVQDPNIRYQAALLCAVVWSVHPIHISAVTYIVQRMASLAGMFYIMGIYFYLKFRFSENVFKQGVHILGYLVVFCLALGTKENSVLLPLSTVLVEVVFFRNISYKNLFRFKGFFLIVILFVLMAGISFVWVDGKLSIFTTGYSNRPFTLFERLMTQSRVICLYLYQLIYPVSSQFSVEHEVMISKNLFSPFTTLTSIGFLSLLLGFGLIKIKKHPLLCFALFFFFLNHLVESTIIPLEMVFEHRNYIPSMFIFMPIFLLVTQFLSSYKTRHDKKILFNFCFISVIVLLFTIGIGTYSRNFDWITEKSLWESAMEKAPGNARPYQSLGTFYYQRIGHWDKAIALHKKAIPLKDSKPASSKMVSYDNLRFYYLQKGDLEAAVKYGEKAVNSKPAIPVVFNYMETLLLADKLSTAPDDIGKFLRSPSRAPKELNLKTIILMKTGQYEQSLENALTAIQKYPFDVDAITYFGYLNFLNARHKKAEYYLNRSIKFQTSFTLFVRLVLIQNAHVDGDSEKKKYYTAQLVENHSLKEILDVLDHIRTEPYPLLPISLNQIGAEIVDYLKTIESKITATGSGEIHVEK